MIRSSHARLRVFFRQVFFARYQLSSKLSPLTLNDFEVSFTTIFFPNCQHYDIKQISEVDFTPATGPPIPHPPLLSIPPFKNKIALFVQSHPASSTFSNPNFYSKAIPGARVRLVKGAVIVFAFSRSQRRETNFLLQTTFRERLAVCMPREGIYCRAMMPQQRFFPRRSGAEDRLAGKK